MEIYFWPLVPLDSSSAWAWMQRKEICRGRWSESAVQLNRDIVTLTWTGRTTRLPGQSRHKTSLLLALKCKGTVGEPDCVIRCAALVRDSTVRLERYYFTTFTGSRYQSSVTGFRLAEIVQYIDWAHKKVWFSPLSPPPMEIYFWPLVPLDSSSAWAWMQRKKICRDHWSESAAEWSYLHA